MTDYKPKHGSRSDDPFLNVQEKQKPERRKRSGRIHARNPEMLQTEEIPKISKESAFDIDNAEWIKIDDDNREDPFRVYSSRFAPASLITEEKREKTAQKPAERKRRESILRPVQSRNSAEGFCLRSC